MKEKLQPYCGPLNAKDTADGMNAAKGNARRLAKDARLLFQNESYASAVALAVLSIEEAGKAFILRELVLARHEAELRKSWRDYRTHTKKNALWPLFDAFFKGARKAREFASFLDRNADHTHTLDKVKQSSIYTDSFKKGHWSIPEEIVTKDLVEGLVRTAEVFASTRVTSTEEMDLWVQYLGPRWKQSTALMEQALFEWDKEIRRRGLLPERQILTMESFFKEGFRTELSTEQP